MKISPQEQAEAYALLEAHLQRTHNRIAAKPWAAEKILPCAKMDTDSLLTSLYHTGAPIIPTYTPVETELNISPSHPDQYLSNGLKLPYRLDFIEVVKDPFDKNAPETQPRAYSVADHDFTVIIDHDIEHEGSYTLNIDAWGLPEKADLTALLSYYAKDLDYWRTLLTGATTAHTPALMEATGFNEGGSFIAPKAGLNITLHTDMQQIPEVLFGASNMSMVIQHRNPRPLDPAEAFNANNLEEDPLAGGQGWHWGRENPLRLDGTHLGNDTTGGEPFTAIWVGGALAQQESMENQAGECSFWLEQWAQISYDYFNPDLPQLDESIESFLELESLEELFELPAYDES